MYQIFVVEDEILIRQSIRSMIEGMGAPYAFCGEAADGEMALSMMQDLMPDILLTDIRMPFLDGLGLIKHAKAMMPWLKVIIISGYDEFESAQRAISLGVDLYLLKPVLSADLRAAVEKVAQQLEKSKAQSGYDKDEFRTALYRDFMHNIFFGGTDTSQLLERARMLEIDIVNPYYQVALFHFEAVERENLPVAELFHYFDGTDQLAVLVCAKTATELNEQTYRIVNMLCHRLRDCGAVVTTVVGNVIERLSAVADAYCAADAMLKKVVNTGAGKVVDINDTAQLTTDIASFSSSFDERRLLYASEEDIPALMEEFSGDEYDSMLFRYYTLIDILRAGVRAVSTARPDISPKDIAVQLSGTHNIFAASNWRDSFENAARQLLLEAVRMKSGVLIKQHHVISKAEEYIAENFCDPNISLISVARHVGFSSAHFSTMFSQALGKSFISYLTSMRIERAKQLLAQTDMKLSAIAMEIGYNEPNYFSHVFKKHEGISPKDFRKKI